jgi:replicative DNA helicase
MEEQNFYKLGFDFQKSLIKAIIEDKKYGESIIDVLETKYFDNNSFRFIIQNVKEYFEIYSKLPNYVTLEQKIISENNFKESHRIHVDTLTEIKNHNNDYEFVKDKALNFCKQQNLRKTLKQVEQIIENGNFKHYDEIEEKIKKALSVGIITNDVVDIFHDVDSALVKEYRNPIPTGIVGIDELLKGGLAKGELGIVLAPTGVGKSTILTKMANTAYNHGSNVLQIFFEDNVGDIKRKHFTIWSGISSDEQSEFSEKVKEKIKEAQSLSTGEIKLIRLPSDNITVTEIKNKVRKLMAEGFKIDLLVIDYVDCISSEKNTTGEEWKGEGNVMRSLESMTNEFDIAIWSATQGGRGSISSEIVTTDQMGGNIKKAQVAHVILSIGKTLEQKEHNLATITMLKSRIGKDGVVFANCTFNNQFLLINTDSQNTLLGHENIENERRANRAGDLYRQRQERLNNQR